MNTSFENTDNLEIHFRKPRFFSGPFLQLNIGAMAGVLGAISIIQTGNAQNIPFHWKALAFILPFFAIIFIARWFSMRRLVKPIVFANDALLLPDGSESYSCKKVLYENILSFDARGRAGKQALVIDTKSKMFTYPLKDFREQYVVEVFGRNLHDRIVSLSEGGQYWKRMLARQELAATLSARKYPVTILLLGLLIIVYIAQLVVGVEYNQFKLIELGANAPDLVKSGQWYRLFAANFLHVNLAHIAINGVALWFLGALLERLTGGLRFLLIFLVSGLLGALCSTLFIKGLFSVGASGAIFGLLGAVGFINWRFRNELPGGYRVPLRSWLIIFGVNVALPVFIPQIDIYAHLGGLIGGALTALIVCVKQASLTGTPLYDRHVKALTAILSSVFLLGSLQAMAHYSDTGKNNIDRMNLVKALLQSPVEDAGMLNSMAWWLAIEPASTFDALQTSRDLANKAVEIAMRKDARNDVAAYQDTLATAYYRLGDFSKAAEIERNVLDQELKFTFASQLARFLKARVEKDGPVILGDAALSDVDLQKPNNNPDGSIVLDLGHPAIRGMDIYAYPVDSDGRILGLLRLSIAPDKERRNYVARISPEVSKLLIESQKLELVFIDAQDCRCSIKQGYEWRFWPYDKSIANLP